MDGHDGEEVIHRAAFAPSRRGWRYPLPIQGPLGWRPDGAEMVAEVALPPVPAGHLVVPSFAAVGSPDWSAALGDGTALAATAAVGSAAAQGPAPAAAAPVETWVDCFTTRAALARPRIAFRVAATTTPADYLAAVSVRPGTVARPPPPPPSTAIDVPAYTQMEAAKDIRHRICSPTCVAMAMGQQGVRHPFGELVALSYHRPTRLFGVWPQNLWAASRWGVLGAVETGVDWSAAGAALAAGQPLVAGIAFAEGGLDGSPLPRTGGHLVIVRGIEDGRVLVNDPAAPDAAGVPRSYDIDQFAAAWLGHRGVFYLFARRGEASMQG